jgi:hypothetical protein
MKGFKRHSRRSRYSVRRIKSRVTYSTREIAELLGVHTATVLKWYKSDLEKIDNSRPFLVMGTALKHFLSNRQTKRRRPCGPHQMMCMKCRMPVTADPHSFHVTNCNAKTALVSANCSICGTRVNRSASAGNLLDTLKNLGCDTTLAKNLSEAVQPVLNTDFVVKKKPDEN